MPSKMHITYVTDGIATPDPKPTNLVNWWF